MPSIGIVRVAACASAIVDAPVTRTSGADRTSSATDEAFCSEDPLDAEVDPQIAAFDETRLAEFVEEGGPLRAWVRDQHREAKGVSGLLRPYRTTPENHRGQHGTTGR